MYTEGKLDAVRNKEGIWINTSVFQEEASNYLKYGSYCDYPWGTPSWRAYWKEQRNRCTNGYEVGGVKIPGDYYFYLNFCRIQKVEIGSGKVGKKINSFPDFWDGDYNYFWIREIARYGLSKKDYNQLHLEVKIPEKNLDGGYNIIVGKSRRKGYQLPHSEIVHTPYGKKTMGEIKVNDIVSTPTGTAKVVALYPQGVDNVYELTLYDGRTVRCGKEHLWKIYSKIYKKNYRIEKVVQTDYLLNDKLKDSKGYKWFLPINNEVINEEIKELPIPPYTLGCILGDGNVTKQLKVSGKDEQVFNEIINELGNKYYFINTVDKYNRQLKYNFTKKEINNIKEKGLLSKYANTYNPLYLKLRELKLDCKSNDKYIPDVYKYHSSIEDRYNIVKGLMDTDSSISTDSSMSFCNKSKKLVEDLQEVLYSLGISSVFRKRKDGLFIIYINSNKELFKLDRKKQRLKTDKKHREYIAITNVKKLDYKEESSCFLLDSEDHLFLTNKYIVTHNSYKSAAIAANKYFTIPRSLVIQNAYEKKYLYPRGIFSMSTDIINFNNDNTGWQMPSDVVNKAEHIRSSYIAYNEGVKTEKGFLSEIIALTCKDNPDVNRGKDATEIFIEEAGAFGSPGLLKDLYSASQDCVMAGSIKTGMITIFGCVCKGTKVWDNNGVLRNIEDITKETGIIGYASKGVIAENISWLKPPAKKECVRITTDKGDSIECSTDHPLLWSKRKYYNYKTNKKKATFKEAKDIKVGDYLLQALQMPKFGDKQMWQPRLVGMLIGDGYYGGKSSCAELCIAEKELWEYVKGIGLDYTVRKDKESNNPFFRYINFKRTQKEMRLLGLQEQSKQTKRLPENIWDYNKDSVAEMLAGYFDADGYVGTQGKRKRITLTSVVKELLEEVKIQLYKLGIQSNIYKRQHKKDNKLVSNVTGKVSIINTPTSYSLEICDLESIRNFKKHIKLLVEKKQNEIDSWDLSKRSNEEVLEYEYEHTIEKGDYFIDNPQLKYLKARKVVAVEFIGEQDIYNLTADYTHTYLTNNFISHNTSGDMEGGTADYASMHSKPLAFGLLPFENIWDNDLKGTTCGFFHPVNWNMEGYYDNQGNSDVEGAKKAELDEREKIIKNGGTSTELTKRGQEKPLSPAEAFTYVNFNNFPVLELNKRLKQVIANQLHKKRGIPVEFSYDRNQLIAKPILNGSANPIDSYGDLPANISGCPVIFESPVENAPKGLYKIGYDPIRQDEGSSLAGIIVYKGNVGIEGGIKHNIVAQYIGRKNDPDDIDLIAEQFAEYYGTKIMYENEITSVKNYFRKRRKLHLLAAQPDNVIKKNISGSKVNRIYGCHMTVQLKDAGERYIKNWLLDTIDYHDGEPISVIDGIYSKRLLEELIVYNRKGNFDLVSALIMCMFQVEESFLNEGREEHQNQTIKDLVSLIDQMYVKHG